MQKITPPLGREDRGAKVANLQDALMLMMQRGELLGEDARWLREAMAKLEGEREARFFGNTTAQLVELLQVKNQIEVSGNVDQATATEINAVLVRLGEIDEPLDDGPEDPEDGPAEDEQKDASAGDRVAGHVLTERGAPAGGVKLRLYSRGFGGAAKLLKEVETDGDGAYAFGFEDDERPVSVELRAVGPDGQEVAEPLSRPLDRSSGSAFGAVNLIAPDALKPMDPEYGRLVGAMRKPLGAEGKLSQAKEEDGGRQDLTLLSESTGWDARLIGMAAVAERVASEPGVDLDAQSVYGLLRAGLPSDKAMLASVSAENAATALRVSRGAGIVSLSDAEIEAFKKSFAGFRTKAVLSEKVSGSEQTYADLLADSGLDEGARKKFADVYFNHDDKDTDLWDAVEDAGLDRAQIGRLRLQGKLSLLTNHSSRMTRRLMGTGIKTPDQLVARGLHQADHWATELFEEANVPAERRDQLNDDDRSNLGRLIPALYEGDNIEQRMDAYTKDLSRRLRVSYPTHTIVHLMENDGRYRFAGAHNATTRLLNNAIGQGFRLSETPLSLFLKQAKGLDEGVPTQEFTDALGELKTLQRLYQITPDDESIAVLRQLGITSAHDVMALPSEEFTANFTKKYRKIFNLDMPNDQQQQIRTKADQVTSVVYNMFASAKRLEGEPIMAAYSGSAAVRDEVRNELIKHMPTMEALFGSTDFCSCEHCRSVLSPAAYLVDLLQFIVPTMGPKPSPSGDTFRFYDGGVDYGVWSTIAPARIRATT